MDIRPKERCDGGRTVPVTVRLTAVMFLEADSVIAKDRMKTGSFVSVFLERVPTGGADMHARSQQETLELFRNKRQGKLSSKKAMEEAS